MTRYVVDAATLLHLIETGAHIDSRHQFVAPNLIRSEVLALLLQAVRSGRLSDHPGPRRRTDRVADRAPRVASRSAVDARSPAERA